MGLIERRSHQRMTINIAVLLALGENGYLSQVINLSPGGAMLSRPKHWTADPSVRPIRAYFIFENGNVAAISSRIVRVQPDHIGLEFVSGQEDRVQALFAQTQ